MSDTRVSTAVLLSGSGTNLQALIDASREEDFPARIDLVISNKPGVKGLERAEQAGIVTAVIPHKDYASRLDFDMAVHERLIEAGIDFVCLAGFMRIMTEDFIGKWLGQMLNIHPALLPAFRGNRAHEQVLASDVTLSGCTVHGVIPDVDAGPIVAQGVVRRYATDDLDSLSARVRQVEHILYPLAVRSFLGQDVTPPETDGMMVSTNPRVRFTKEPVST